MVAIFDTGTDHGAHGRRVAQHNAAVRAIDDPAKLRKAARIVRVAIERGRLDVADVVPDEVVATG